MQVTKHCHNNARAKPKGHVDGTAGRSGDDVIAELAEKRVGEVKFATGDREKIRALYTMSISGWGGRDSKRP